MALSKAQIPKASTFFTEFVPETPPKDDEANSLVLQAFQNLLIVNDKVKSCIQSSSFYKSPTVRALFPSAEPSKKNVQPATSKRKQTHSHPSDRKRFRAYSFNAGVSHSIRRPKLKKTPDSSKEKRGLKRPAATLFYSPPAAKKAAMHLTLETENNEIELPSPAVGQVPLESPDVPEDCKKEEQGRKCSIGRDLQLKFSHGVLSFTKESLSPPSNRAATRKVAAPPKVGATFESPTKSKIEAEQNIIEDKVKDILGQLDEDWADDDDVCEQASNSHKATPVKPNYTSEEEFTLRLTSEDEESKENIFSFTNETSKDNSSETCHSEEKAEEKKYFSLFYKMQKRSAPQTPPENSPTLPNPGSAAKKRFKLYRKDPKYEQMMLDAGQKAYGIRECKTCGILYSIGEPEDEIMHAKYHEGCMENLQHKGWKNERIVGQYAEGRVIMIIPGDPKSWWRRVELVKDFVDEALGINEEVRSNNISNMKIFLYIVNKMVVGCLMAEYVHQGFRVIKPSAESRLVKSSSEPVPIKCGISRIWTAKNFRKQNIGSRLVDCMRAQFVYGEILSLDSFAFSSPTPDGMIFAERYTKTPTFLVYHQ